MQRRSSHRVPRKTYSEDAFAELPELQGLPLSPKPAYEHDDDDAFTKGQGSTEDDDSDHDARLSEQSEDVEHNEDESPVKKPRKQARVYKRQPKKPPAKESTETFTRRLHDYLRANSKGDRYLKLFGPIPADAKATLEAVERWSDFPVLPPRSKDKYGRGGFCEYKVPDPQLKVDLEQTEWRWYFEQDGRTAFESRQVLTPIDEATAADYLSLEGRPLDVLIGPLKSPALQTISKGHSIPIAQAWPTPDQSRVGYIVNTGARVNGLQWLPHCTGPKQYLAVSILPPRSSDHPPLQAPAAPAYTPSPPWKTALQIWGINTSSTEQGRADLTTLLCTHWGDIRTFEFCPSQASLPDQTTPLLMAGIWSDGKLRVLDLPRTILSDEENQAFHVKKAAITYSPPNTVFTCLTWLTPRLIAAGCANGCIAIVDLHETLASPNDPPMPQKYGSISDTYIHHIQSCAPTYPHHVFTLSMDGYLRLTDTSQPDLFSPSSTAQAGRNRSLLPALVWSSFAVSAIITDDNFNVRAYPIRRMFSQFSAGRMRSTALCMATSPCHPYVLLGTTGGEAVCTNAITRVLDYKSAVLSQIWFAHEWRRPTESDQARSGEAGERIAKQGLSRFTEGYRAEQVSFNDGEGGGRRNIVPMTVYEKGTAVTAVAWCPSMDAAGWAAAGMADGLVRIEDIAI